MCGERDESITHLIAECKKLVQKEYKDMKILQELYTWNYARSLAQLVRLSGIITNLQVQLRMTVSKYGGVLISKQIMSSNTKDLTEKSEKKYHLIYIAVSRDKRIEQKEQEKLDNYTEPRRDLELVTSCCYSGCYSCTPFFINKQKFKQSPRKSLIC